MKRPSVFFHPDAVRDVAEARVWYAERAPRLGDDFMAQLDHALAQITETPEAWPPAQRQTRRYLMHRFPYAVVYRLIGAEIQVIAVAHGHREPGYWRKR